MAFLLPWFPWKNYHEGDWLSGRHLVVSLCAFPSMLTFFSKQSVPCLLRLSLDMKVGFSLLSEPNGCPGRIYKHHFLWPCLWSHGNGAQFAGCCCCPCHPRCCPPLCWHVSHVGLGAWKKPRGKPFLRKWTGSPRTSIISQMKQDLAQKNFCLFLIMNFVQVFHLTSSVTSWWSSQRISFPRRLFLLPWGASWPGQAPSAHSMCWLFT